MPFTLLSFIALNKRNDDNVGNMPAPEINQTKKERKSEITFWYNVIPLLINDACLVVINLYYAGHVIYKVNQSR